MLKFLPIFQLSCEFPVVQLVSVTTGRILIVITSCKISSNLTVFEEKVN